MNSVRFCGGVIEPSKVICIGRNYVDHIAELGNEVPDSMVVFVKPNSAISEQLRSGQAEEHHYETEICFLFEKGAFRGVGVGIDVTRRGLQKTLKSKGLPWERSKAFDGSALFSEFVPYVGEEMNLGLELVLNGQIAQRADANLMIHSPAAILEEVQSFMTLEEGDLVMTGTPAGVGAFFSGDRLMARLLSSGEVLAEREWLAA